MGTPQHDQRRNQIISAAYNLFLSEGYENTTIARIIEEVEIAKGTFYHYFSSKEALLTALTEAMFVPVLADLARVVESTTLTPLEKLRSYFQGAAVWKANNPELMTTLLTVMYRDDNIVLRHQLNRFSLATAAPVIGQIIAQGVASGEFHTPDPHRCARAIMSSFVTAGEVMAELLLRVLSGGDTTAILELQEEITFFEHAIGRMLGVNEDIPLDLIDKRTVLQMIQQEATG